MQTQKITENSPLLHQPLLIVLHSAHSEPLKLQDFNVLGRDGDCHLQLKDPSVSRRHARILRRNGRFFIVDLRSRNGTKVNHLPIVEAELRSQDIIEIGQTHLLFIDEADYAAHNKDHPELTSKNADLQAQLNKLPAFARSDLNVMLLGPSGSGKEILARAIHQLSPRAQEPFVAINCSGFSENLVESELFGHCRGSFTGAIHDHKGAFAQANNGTLFLDEIGDLPLALQPKLLRALESQEIRPVGSEQVQRINTRIICATHKSLLKLVQQGQFRLDLYYRLNAAEFYLPALKDRLEDFDGFLYRFAREFRVGFSFSAIEQMKKHSWPGNIRELKNTVAKAAALFPHQKVEASDVAALIISPPQVTSPTAREVDPSTWHDVQKMLIERQLLLNHGNQRKAAHELGIPKSTLHDKIKFYQIDLQQIKRLGPTAW